MQRKVVVDPKTFCATIMKLATVEQVHVMKWSGQYPQMEDPEWRSYVMARMRILQQSGIFTEVKFSPPDELDDEWMFCATIGRPVEASIQQGYKENYMVGEPLGMWDYLLILAIVLFIAAIVVGAIVFMELGGGQ